MSDSIGGAEDAFKRQYASLALAAPYLLHNVLAVSAMHLYLMDPSRQELSTRALQLHNTALGLARPHLISLRSSECLAMFLFAGLTAVYGLAEGSAVARLDFEPIPNPLERILACFRLARGINSLLGSNQQFIAASWVGPMVWASIAAGRDQLDQFDGADPDYTTIRTLSFGLEDPVHRRACLRAAEDLFRCIHAVKHVQGQQATSRFILGWPVGIDATFEGLLEQKKPVALIILAYYAVLLHYGHSCWWTCGWPAMLLRFIDAELGQDWAEFLNGAKLAVFGSDKSPEGDAVASR